MRKPTASQTSKHRKASLPKQPGLMSFVVPRLSEGLKPKSGLAQQALRLKLARAGFSSAHAVELFLCLKLMCLLAAGLAGGIAGSLYLGRQQCLPEDHLPVAKAQHRQLLRERELDLGGTPSS